MTDPAEMGGALRSHWRGVFAARRPHQTCLQKWLGEELSQEEVPNWEVKRKDLRRAIAEAPASSRGPDGLPLAA